MIEFVAAYRRWLQGTLALLYAVLFGLLIALRSQQELILEKWHLALVLLVFFVVGTIHALLMYDAWFTRGKNSLLGKVKKVAFFLIVVTYMSILLLLLKEFVL